MIFRTSALTGGELAAGCWCGSPSWFAGLWKGTIFNRNVFHLCVSRYDESNVCCEKGLSLRSANAAL